MTTLQNFYKATITRNWTATTGDFNVSIKPTTSSGWLIISPGDDVRREIVKFSATGTNAYGDFVTISNIADRGVGGTTAQIHSIGEKVRMNITAEHWAELNASAVAPTLDVGTTTTLDPGSDATATNSGSTINAIFDLGIPAGSTIYSGTSIPDNSVGRNGDWAFDTSVNSYVWYKSGGAWALVNSLKGATGDGNGIASIVKTNTVGLVDTYTITYDDSTTTTFNVTNGDTGDIGIDWQGDWSAGSYTVTQAVSHNGSSWIATTTTSEEPSISATDWDLIASKGLDGAGTGDMVKSTYDTTNKNTDIFTYADGKVEDSIVDGHTTIAPSGNAVFDALAGKQATLSKATQAEVVVGTDNDKYVTPLAVQPYSNNSLYRQAIINGNFDVWQRSTSYNGVLGGAVPVAADKWAFYNEEAAAAKVISRELLTSGDIFGSKYYQRFTVDGAGTFAAGTQCFEFQHIENGTSKLCGNGKNVTLSFYARASVASKKLGLFFQQNYGTGGSPSATDSVSGGTITLTSSWVKYTYTFTTATLAGKTFGTNNNDYIEIRFGLGWGSTVGTNNGWGSAETFGGAGTIDIAQVQLNAGSIALPFQPKSYAEELRDCQRYCYGITTILDSEIIGFGIAASTTVASIPVFIPKMRIAPSAITVTPSDWVLNDSVTATDVTTLTLSSISSGSNVASLVVGVASGLTQYRSYRLGGDGTAGRVLILSAEL